MTKPFSSPGGCSARLLGWRNFLSLHIFLFQIQLIILYFTSQSLLAWERKQKDVSTKILLFENLTQKSDLELPLGLSLCQLLVAPGPGSLYYMTLQGCPSTIKNFLCNIIFWKSSFSTEVLRGCFREWKVLWEETHRSYLSCQGQASSLRNGLYHLLLTIASQAIEKLLPCKL